MPEIIKFSLYKNKVTKYIFGMVLACFVMPLCNAQPPRNIDNFQSATWNSDGARWDIVYALMNMGLDIFAIQEAGSLGNISGQLQNLAAAPLPICFRGIILAQDTYIGVSEYIWNVSGQTFYLYYYDNPVEDPDESGTSTSKQNMAIISRHRADEVIIIPKEVRGLSSSYNDDPQVVNNISNTKKKSREDRIYVNRPVLGIRINNSVFFSIHPEPTRDRNEAGMLISSIQDYMQEYHQGRTWMVMGDFNRLPERLDAEINRVSPPDNTFRETVSSGRITHPARRAGQTGAELDYAVIGGPSNLSDDIHIQAVLLLSFFQQNRIDNPSDHIPVKFN
ncbi:endonuclease/exonuclease/phosphatase family protein [Candidatus Williamhamiltonella defendens]|uniref:endonuclease/exonuclease/phosphatase family protein n=1 Tax=Candidatus Williamhamiltonella defendens TaxID=138072 RepID=UPI00145275C5|nr:endonuclease/exonuclease/phosphatase family protein [Candidatus Hamiltonella defensa]CAB3623637.1 Putative cytolethal distending toxin nuclease subunit CdtB [Bacteriophage APSE-7]